MRRRRLAAGLALLLLALAGAAAWALAQGAPDRLRGVAERRLSEALGTEVTLERAGLSLRWGLLLEARGVAAWPRPGGPALRVARLYARPDWWSLLAGRFRLGWLRLEGAELHVARGPGGLALGHEPPAGREAARPGPEPAAGARALVAAVEDALHAAVGGGIPVRALRVADARIELRERGPEGPRTLVLADTQGRARQARLGSGGSLQLDARVFEASPGPGPEEEGSVALHAELAGERELAFELAALPLDVAAPWAGALGLAPGLAGRASGSLTWRWRPGGPHRFDGALEARDLRLPLARGGAPLRLEAAALRAELRVAAERLELASARLGIGPLQVRGSGALGLPVRPETPLRLRVETGDLPLARAGALAASLPAPLGPALAEPLARIEAGRLASLEAELDTSWAGVRELVESRGLARPGALAFRARVEDAALRVAVGERVDALTGELRLEEGTLHLEARPARFAGDPLPALDASFRGLSALGSPEAFRCPAPAPVPQIPGWRVLQAVLADDPEDAGAREGWTRVGLRVDRLAHPALLCTLERAAAEITPAGEDGFAFAVPHGRWAGLPIRARGHYTARPAERVELAVELGSPSGAEPPRARPAADGVWARGAFTAEIGRAGPFDARRAEGRFRAAGTRLRLERATLALDPGGAVQGELAFELARNAPLPYDARVELAEAELAEILRAGGSEEPALTGRLSGAGAIRGRLERGRSPLLEARGTFSLHARKGTLRRQLPVVLAIALASEGWNPFREEDVIAYRALDVVARLEEGYAVAETLALDAPRLRAAGSGRVALAPPHEVEGVVGLYFFRTLDTLLGRIPVLNRALLGKDQNLLGAYFALSGPWGRPQARLVPVKTMASGPASILLEGVPDLFAGSVRRLQSVLLPDDGAGEGGAGSGTP